MRMLPQNASAPIIMNRIKINIHRRTSSPPSQIIKFIDLCSGIGGFRLGLSDQRFKCVFSADIKSDAVQTYNLNFNEAHRPTDINEITELPAFDMLCAGFPCQPFISAGQKKGFNDKRGGIIFKILDICSKYRPEYVLLENVSNLLILEKGKIIERIVHEFQNLDYHVSYRKLCSSNFGLAQKRERVYIMCARSRLIDLSVISTSNRAVTFGDIIDRGAPYNNLDATFTKKLCDYHRKHSILGKKIGDKRGGQGNIHSWDLELNGTITDDERELLNKILTARRQKHWAEKKSIRWMDGMPLTVEEISTFYPHEDLPNMLQHLTELKYLNFEYPKDLADGKRVYSMVTPKGYNINKGKLSFPLARVLSYDDCTPTLTATDTIKLGVLLEHGDDIFLRKLTELELKRLCGFPEDFIIPPNVNMYDLFGNMATPPVISAISKLIS